MDAPATTRTSRQRRGPRGGARAAGRDRAARAACPRSPLRRWAQQRGERGSASRAVEPDRDLVPGVEVDTDLGDWHVIETPGHAPSHVCLYQPERRLLISGDHLLGRVSLYFDYG